ncbi:MAG: Serine/threonine-protein kinase PknB [Myxococcaceae bacterium]|nr:Serine/threonine-protein kinase PknB [Myxococcaceae bacterium]
MGERAHEGFASVDAAMSVPRIFGRLVLLKLLARGGMGDVYLATTTGIEGAERACVVKTVRRDHIHDGSFLARFLDEARVQSQLNHPGVAQVLEAATDENGEPYTVVEYVEGRSLSDVRQRAIQLGARIGWPEAVAIAIEMAQALAHVHERSGADGTPLGIVHRDLSPQNVMIGYAGEVKLIDFGTARGQNRRCHTVAGVVFAKPGYVAPEVARQEVGDGRIDLYALGIMLWELCAGRRFLNGDAQQHLEDAAAGKLVIPKIAAELKAPALLDEAIAKLTTNDPDERYATAHIAANDLAKVIVEAPPGKQGERGVRGRINALMKTLWSLEPARSRADFAKSLRDARGLQKEAVTPHSGTVQIAAKAMNDDMLLSGTPYRLIKKIGEGASGVVYEAEHTELGRRLALKVLAPEHASAKDAIERFRREARAIAALSHANLCLLYDFGKALDGRIFLAMELLSGETLEKRLKDTKGMDWREAATLGIEVTRALEAAHAAGLVHRDLKPANLYLTSDGGLKLLDFGVAMALSDNAQDEKRQKGFAIFGTPEYMAPEQVAGETVDGRCDLYALGCVLYELVTGERPFEGDSSVVVMGKQLREVPEPPQSKAPTRAIPTAFDAIIMTALAKKPENRYASAQVMREALQALLVMPTRRQQTSRRAASAVFASVAVIAMLAIGARAAHRPASDVAKADVAPAVEHAVSAPETALAVVETPPSEGSPTGVGVPEPMSDSTGAVTIVSVSNPPVALHAAMDAKVAKITHDVKDSKDSKDTKDTKDTKDAKVVVASAVPVVPNVAIAASTKEDPNNPKEWSRIDRRKLQDARAYANDHPTEVPALKQWALTALRIGDIRDARRAADAWALHDGSAEPRLFLAAVLDAGGHRHDARAVVQEVLDIHPDSTDARRMYTRLGQQRLAQPEPETRRNHIARR